MKYKFTRYFVLLATLCTFFGLHGFAEGTKELNSNGVKSTVLYLCNDYTNHCSGNGGVRTQFAAYDATYSADDLNRLYFTVANATEVVYLGFQGGDQSNNSYYIVYRIREKTTGNIVQAEQKLPTSGTGWINTITQAQNGPNALIVPPNPANGYDAYTFTPPGPGTYYIEFSRRLKSNDQFYIYYFTIELFDITVADPVAVQAKPGRVYSKAWQFDETAKFYGTNYIISDDSIVTSASFNNMQGGAWVQYCNSTGCGITDWTTDRKSLFNQQALYPQYKIFLNTPDPVLFPSATTLGTIIAPDPYGIRNCNGTIDFMVNVSKTGNVEIDLDFTPSTYVSRVLPQAVSAGANVISWDGKDKNGVSVPNNVTIAFTVKYINGLTNLPLYDVEGNPSGFIVKLVAPTGGPPNIFWDDVNIWQASNLGGGDPPGFGTNTLDVQSNTNTTGCASPVAFPGCHKWPSTGSGWGNHNTINSWWYTVSTSTTYPSITEFRSPQTITLQPVNPICAGGTGVTITATPETNTEVYHWAYTGTGGSFSPSNTTTTPTVTLNLAGNATSGNVTVYGTNANCGDTSPGPISQQPVTLLPVPQLTSLTPQNTCSGFPFSYTLTSNPNPPSTTYSWIIGIGDCTNNIQTCPGSSSGSSISGNLSVTDLNPGTVTYHITPAAGICSGTPQAVVVTVKPSPVPTITQQAASVCVNVPVTYSTEQGMTSYSWSTTSDGILTATANPYEISVTWPTSGAKSLSITYTDADGCLPVSPTTVPVTVNALPVPTVVSGENPVCIGVPGKVYTTQTGMTGYTWSITGGIVTSGGSTSSAVVTWNTPGSQSISVNYTNPSTQCTAIDPTTSYPVTVNPLPDPTINGPSTACVNTPGAKYYTEPGQSGYTWVVNGGTWNYGVTNDTIYVVWTSIGSNTVSVNYTSPLGCTAVSPKVITVTGTILPNPTITGASAICSGISTNYSTQSGMSGYVWNISAGGTINNDDGNGTVNVTWNTPGPNTLSVNYSLGSGCTALAPFIFPVTVNQSTPPTLQSTINPVCQLSTSTYTTQAGMSAYIWTISPGGTRILGGSSTENTVTVRWDVTGPQYVRVNFTNTFGCIAPAPAEYQVTVNPLPAASISGTTAICQNSTAPLVTFTATSLTTAPYTFTYNINGGSPQTIFTTSGNSVSVPAPTTIAGTFNYNLVSVRDGSATACLQAQTGVATITVNSLLTASLSGSTSVCMNSSSPLITFSVSPPTVLPYTFTYNVNGGAPQMINATSGTSVTFAAPTNVVGTFSYNLVSVQDGSGTACSQVQTGLATVTVNPLPVPTITGPSTACVSTPGPKYYTEPGQSGYTWAVNGGTWNYGLTNDTINIVWTSTGSKTVSVNYTSPLGCTAASPKVITVTVTTLPNPTITGASSICTGIASNYTTQTGMSGYIWTVSSGGTINNNDGNGTLNVTWNTTGSKTVSVNYSLGSGCTALAPFIFPVTVNQSTPPTIQSTVNPVCASYTSLYTTQAGMSSYIWTISPGGTRILGGGSTENTVTVRWDVSGPQYVRVNFTNTDGCIALAPTEFTVTVNPLPVTTISGSTAVCQDFPTPYTYSVSDVNPATYSWSLVNGNGTITPSPNSNPITINWNTPGSDIVKIDAVSSLGCTNSSSVNVTINAKPAPQMVTCFDPITTRGAKRFLLKGGSPIYPMKGEYLVTPSISALSNDGSGNYYFDPSLAPVNTYHFSYRYTNANGCINTSSMVQLIVQAASNTACGGTMVDPRDQKSYATMSVAGKCWMAENLNYNATNAAVDYQITLQTDNCILEKYCPPTDATCTHGAYYQWDELVQYKNTDAPYQGLCPPGWHVPTDAEWQTLIDNFSVNFTGVSANALVGTDLKNSTKNFKALLEGMNYLNGSTWTFATGGVTATMYWTSTLSGGKAIARGLNNPYNPSVSKYASSPANAFPVRCLRDN